MENEDDIDKLFKQGLKDPEIPFNELDWERMEQKLDAKKTKRLVPIWILTAGSIAAAILIFLFWFFMVPEKKSVKEAKGTYVDKPSKPIKYSKDSSAVTPSPLTKGLTWPEQKNVKNELKLSNDLVQVPKRQNGKEEGFIQLPDPIKVFDPKTEQANTVKGKEVHSLADSLSAIGGQKSISEKDLPANKTSGSQKAEYAKVENSIRRKMESAFNRKQGFTLSLMAAPDVTTAASSKPAKLSSNLGVLVTYSLSNTLSLTSGAVYAKKYYNSAGLASQTTSYPGQAWEVDADCNVLDIPVNLNYRLFSKKNIAVSVNTGLSSYLMLKERYKYLSGEPGAGQQVSSIEIRNQNQHIFGVANVSISVDRKITPTLSIAVQPFMKIPLTGIGNGKVDLKSTGLSFSLNIGLFPAKKQEKSASIRY
jgi:hypothetical protein